MSLKAVLKSVTPPILLEAYRRWARPNGPCPHTWEGVYAHYRDVPVAGEGHDGPIWAGIVRAETEAAYDRVARGGSRLPPPGGDQSALPLLAASVLDMAGKVRVLDFGGGMGIGYLSLIGSLAPGAAVEYWVVETERLCEAGRRLFAGDPRIHFSSTLPRDIGVVDIIHLDSVLQYVEDYAACLRALCAYRSRHILFVRLSAGEFATHASCQKNIPGMAMAYWFINLGEILDIMSANGYALVWKGASEEAFEQENFPPEYRMGRTCNLLFALR